MLRGVGIAVVLCALVVGCSDDEPSTAGDLDAGDCVVEDATTKADDVEVVDCDEDHVLQAIGRADLPDGAFPGADAVATTGLQLCQGDLFQSYIGVPYVESARIYVSALGPGEDAWADGDRTVVCVAHQQDRSPTTGSYEGAERAE